MLESTRIEAETNSSVRILLVEDSAAEALVVRMHLEHGLEQPFVLIQVASVREAIRELSDGPPFDLVLLDLTVADSAGLATFRTVKTHVGDTPIVVLSGIDDRSVALESLRLGGQDFVFKSELSEDVLGREVRFAMERNRRVQAERELALARQQIVIARQIQAGLYPQTAPTIEGFDLAGRAWAADHVCGDYYDFIASGSGRWTLVVGDVSGHGLGAALKMVEARACLHSLVTYQTGMRQLITAVNRLMREVVEPAGEVQAFLTLFMADFDPSTRAFTYLSAGHPGYLITNDGSVVDLPAMEVPLGLKDDFDAAPSQPYAIDSGAMLFVPTDGFHEAGCETKRSLYGRERMLSVVTDERERPAGDIIQQLYGTVRSFSGNRDQEDDMTALVLKSL